MSNGSSSSKVNVPKYKGESDPQVFSTWLKALELRFTSDLAAPSASEVHTAYTELADRFERLEAEAAAGPAGNPPGWVAWEGVAAVAPGLRNRNYFTAPVIAAGAAGAPGGFAANTR